MKDEMIKILLLNAHNESAASIKKLLEINKIDSVIVSASDTASFLEKVNWVVPDVVLMDNSLNGLPIQETVQYIKNNLPSIPFLFITSNDHQNGDRNIDLMKSPDHFINPQTLYDFSNKIVKVTQSLSQTKTINDQKRKQEYQSKLFLHKSITLLKQTEDFPSKKEILGSLLEVVQHSSYAYPFD